MTLTSGSESRSVLFRIFFNRQSTFALSTPINLTYLRQLSRLIEIYISPPGRTGSVLTGVRLHRMCFQIILVSRSWLPGSCRGFLKNTRFLKTVPLIFFMHSCYAYRFNAYDVSIEWQNRQKQKNLLCPSGGNYGQHSARWRQCYSFEDKKISGA